MKPILQVENIQVNLPIMEKQEAIHLAATLLEEKGYVKHGYYSLMLQKEQECQTYIGNGVAIPHGISHSESEILYSGIVVLQFKQPINYDGNEVYLLIGIAGKNNEHIEILANIACLLQDMDHVWEIVNSNDSLAIYQKFSSMNNEEGVK